MGSIEVRQKQKYKTYILFIFFNLVGIGSFNHMGLKSLDAYLNI